MLVGVVVGVFERVTGCLHCLLPCIRDPLPADLLLPLDAPRLRLRDLANVRQFPSLNRGMPRAELLLHHRSDLDQVWLVISHFSSRPKIILLHEGEVRGVHGLGLIDQLTGWMGAEERSPKVIDLVGLAGGERAMIIPIVDVGLWRDQVLLNLVTLLRGLQFCTPCTRVVELIVFLEELLERDVLILKVAL